VRIAMASPADPAWTEDTRGVPIDRTIPPPGRSLVSRRAIVDLVRVATLGSYGVIGFGGSRLGRFAERIGLAPSGVRVRLDDGLAIELDLVVAHGVPVAEVARQVDSAVRYAIRRSLDREVDRLAIRVDGLRIAPFDVDAAGLGGQRAGAGDVGPDDLAASGMDVA
jgi:uncharacterized alkaline shock family protein YloU